MKYVYSIALLLLLSASAHAQPFYLKGMVRDTAGHPLTNVTIELRSTGYVYHSGSEGTFGIITQKRTDSLRFRHTGFREITVAATPDRMTEVVLHRLPPARNAYANRLSSLIQNLKRETQQQWFAGDETYASIVDNEEVSAAAYPSTSLSLHVDRASYSNIRRFLNMGSPVPPDAVRIEEMLNYFNLGYNEPDSGQTFRFASALTDCPWKEEAKLLLTQVSSRKLDVDSLPQSHLVFLIDVSGSMDMPNRLPLLKSGFRSLVHNLRAQDSVSIVIYGGTVGIALPTTSGAEKEVIFRAIDSLQPGGSTPGASGIRLAYSVAKNHFIEGGNNRIILATDGDFNVGLRSEEELQDLVVNHRLAGIYLTCLGIGMGNYKDSKIQALAQQGNGTFAYLDSYEEAEKVLLKEFTQNLYTVAEDATLQVRFDPQWVRAYRLVGFGNKVGALKDSLAVMEGGEVGPAQTMLVAFELVPTEAGAAALARGEAPSFLEYGLSYLPVEGEGRTAIRSQPGLKLQTFETLNQPLRFAAAVMVFGGLLRDSRHFREVGWNEAARLAEGSAEEGSHSQVEFLRLVETAREMYGKRKRKRG